MDEMETRRQLSEVALGNVPADLVITHGRLFNVYTREFIPDQAVWIKNGWIAYVGPDHDPPKDKDTQFIDSEGMVLLPGLIDGHTHLTASKTLVDEFVKHVIPTGTTTVITETMELGSVAGKDGIEWFVRGLDGQPIRFFYTVPPLCGLTPTEEAIGTFKRSAGSLSQRPKMRRARRSLLEQSLSQGKPVGESPWARLDDAYVREARGRPHRWGIREKTSSLHVFWCFFLPRTHQRKGSVGETEAWLLGDDQRRFG